MNWHPALFHDQTVAYKGDYMSTYVAAPAAQLEPMTDLNMTPLIDVMLVLIIMLIMTIPRQNHAINLTMPTISSNTAVPKVVAIEVDFDGSILWNGSIVPNRASLESKFATLAALKDETQVQLRTNKLAPYRYVAGVMATARRAGVDNIGMIGNEQFL